MSEFIPDDMTTFVVNGSHVTTVFEDISYTAPTEIHGAYYVHEEGRSINVYVMDPSNKVLYKRTGEVQGIMTFETTKPGKYTFIFSNLDDWNDRTATFALHTYEEKDEVIQFDINENGDREIVFDPNASTD